MPDEDLFKFIDACESQEGFLDRVAPRKGDHDVNFDERVTSIKFYRQRKLNLYRVEKPSDARTIEFRQFPGTATDAQTIAEWVSLLGRLVVFAIQAEIIAPLQKDTSLLDRERDFLKFVRLSESTNLGLYTWYVKTKSSLAV